MQQHAAQLRQDHLDPVPCFQPLHWSRDELTWHKAAGFGYYEITAAPPYDQAYFNKYVAYARTPLGEQLTRFRVALVNTYLPRGAELIDVGIGCGQFVDEMAKHRPTFGFDVNPAGIMWLERRMVFRDPTAYAAGALTFWDAFEHIREPTCMLASRPPYVFMSLPVFEDEAHARRSKHFRPDEHCWYFTDWGLIREMDRAGYSCLEMSRSETRLGREDIGSFAFQRR